MEEEGAELAGMTVQMDLPELGLTGEAILIDIRSAPAIEPLVDHLDTRQVVTATFHHSSGDVIDLVVADTLGERQGVSPPSAILSAAEPHDQIGSGALEISDSKSPPCDVPQTEHLKPKTSGEAETEPIGTTSNHPFWSVDRQEFVQAGSLEIGERLQTLSGDVKVVQQKLPRPGPQPVFNLEVHCEHVYFVGQDGVLVHNSGPQGQYVNGATSQAAVNRQPHQYHSYHDVTLDPTKYFSSDSVQFRIADKNLIAEMSADADLRRQLFKRHPELSDWITDTSKHSNSPPGLTWHHDEQAGLLRLVSWKDHSKNSSIYHPTGEGGRSIWGGGDLGRTGKLRPDGSRR